ncbi:DUF721 domain-containing protein [Pontiella sulfatireligans]|nr:DUF721 domain-containing protein [Pontiella sulfatireligans]
MNRDRWDMDKVRFHLSKPPAPNRKIRSLGDILVDVVSGLDQPVQENVRVLRDAWPKLVGEQIAKHSEPGFIKDFTLHVFVDLPGWMPELERVKRLLLQKLQSSYRELRIRRLNLILKHK